MVAVPATSCPFQYKALFNGRGGRIASQFPSGQCVFGAVLLHLHAHQMNAFVFIINYDWNATLKSLKSNSSRFIPQWQPKVFVTLKEKLT